MNLKEKLNNAYDDTGNNEKPLFKYYKEEDVKKAVLEFEKEIIENQDYDSTITSAELVALIIKHFGDFEND